MDNCPLIDFNSPEQKRADLCLIPECLGVPTVFSNGHVGCTVTEDESNPFDLVECQVAANTAAENDPFEMVFNDAMRCKSVRETKHKSNTDAVQQSEPVADHGSHSPPQGAQVTLEAADPSEVISDTVSCGSRSFDEDVSLERKSPFQSDLSGLKAPDNHFNEESKSMFLGRSFPSGEGQVYNNLDEIPPPDWLMNATIDATSILDDTLPAIISQSPSVQDHALVQKDEQPTKSIASAPSFNHNESHEATYKSDEELRLSAQRKIEKIICEAQAVNDMQVQDVKKRQSFNVFPDAREQTCPSVPQNVFSELEFESMLYSNIESSSSFCEFLTDKKSDDFSSYFKLSSKVGFESSDLLDKINNLEKQQNLRLPQTLSKDSLSLLEHKEWSAYQSKKSSLSLSDLTALTNSCTRDPFKTVDRCGDSSILDDIALLDLLDDNKGKPGRAVTSIPPHSGRRESQSSALSLDSPLKRSSGASSSSSLQGSPASPASPALPALPALPASPTLLTLPLCEDAVRNLSLCSKLSPISTSSAGSTHKISVASNLKEKTFNQPKLSLRKSAVQPRTQSRMAPMKATAPIQNMTRVKTSPVPVSKRQGALNSTACIPRRLTSKEDLSKSSLNTNNRWSQASSSSPCHIGVNRAPNNLSSPGKKLLTRLPSPRRQSGVCNDVVAFQGSKPPTRLPSPGRQSGTCNDVVAFQGSKPPTRLPSPRRSEVLPIGSAQMKKRQDGRKEKNVQVSCGSAPFVLSPKTSRKGSPCVKSGSQVRVLSDVNTSRVSWKSPKRRLHQLELPRRNRSPLTEKENLVS